MITEAHSEQLAIWAFRTRVWDYFVRPIDTARLLEDIDTLRNIRQGVPAAMTRTSLDLINAIPLKRACAAALVAAKSNPSSIGH